MGDHGVNPRERKNEGDDGECRQQYGREPAWRQRLGNELRHRFHVEDESVLVDLRNSSVHVGIQRQGIAIGSHEQRDRGLRIQPFRKIELVSGIGIESRVPHVADDTDDRRWAALP